MIRKQGGPPKNPRDGDRHSRRARPCARPQPRSAMRFTTTGSTPSTRCRTAGCFPSPGVVVSARPQPPVSPLEAPRLLLEPGGRVRIDWIEPVRGSVKILRTAHPLPHPAGTRLADRRGRGARGPLDRAGRPRSSLRPRAAGRGALLLHAADALGRHAGPSGTAWPSAAWRIRPTCGRRGPAAASAPVPAALRVTLRWRWAAEASCHAWSSLARARPARARTIPRRSRRPFPR